MAEQNFKNHGRMVTGFHYVLFGVILLAFILSIFNFYYKASYGNGILEASIFLLLTIGVLLASWYARVFALKAQDRAIRAEENFRHYALTGKPLDKQLKMSQIIALRFAPDDEFIELANKAVAQDLKSKEIKAEIKSWKADHNRA